MAASTRESFEGFAALRGGSLWRLAWLLTADERVSEELVETALARALPRWPELERNVAGVEAGVRRELVAAYLSAAPYGVAEPAGTGDDLRTQVLAALARLPAQQRAAVVLLRCPGVARWEAADALDVAGDELARLEREAVRVAGSTSERATRLLHRLPEVIPAAPALPDLARRASGRAARDRRRRLAWSAGAATAVTALLAVSVLASVLVGGDGSPSRDGAGGRQHLPVAERLVDQMPIPDRCAAVPDVPEPPAYAFDPEGADAVWLRFCPAEDVDGSLAALPFAPDDTVVAQEIDDLLTAWTSTADGLDFCDFTTSSRHGLVRLQVGTLDGELHVVDVHLGRCGRVSIDRQPARVDGRAAFADTVGLLGRDLLSEVDAPGQLPGRGPAAPPSCPASIDRLPARERTTVPDYPGVRRLALPLPAASALVCRYPAAPPADQGAGSRPTVRAALLDGQDAEWMRAAYLAGLAADARVSDSPRAGTLRRCGPDPDAPWYGVLVSDPTGSRRTFTVGPGRCAGGPWLAEVLAAAFLRTSG